MKNILVPIDFSEQSVSAFRFALDIAAKSNAQVALLHIISLPILHDSPVSIGGLRKPLIDEFKEIAHQNLSRLIDRFYRERTKIKTHVVIGNHIHHIIINHIKKESFDLVVMGTKGASGMREWMIGSNTEKMVRTSPVPVLSVKQYMSVSTIKNIVFPTALDTTNQEELVMKLKALQNLFQATLHIVWINTSSGFKSHSEIRQQLEDFTERHMLRDFTINVFNYTNEETGIVEFTNQIKGDLIAMGTHGLKGLAHVVAGSIAEDVVNHVRHPVWTFCTRSIRHLNKMPDDLAS